MAQIPAICQSCGLIFPSVFPFGPGTIVFNNATTCSRCRNTAFTMNGYGAIIDGIVTFIASNEFSREQKLFLLRTMAAVGRGEIHSDLAAEKLDSDNEQAGRLFREIVVAGSAFVGAMAAVGMFVLTYIEGGGNEPLENVAANKFDDVIVRQYQPAAPPSAAPRFSLRPVGSASTAKPKTEKGQRNSASTKPPYKNRQARRAAIKKNRSKTKK